MAGETANALSRKARVLVSRSLVPFMLLLGLAQLCIAGLIGWTIYTERQARSIGRQETDSLLAVNQLVEAALDAETGQRGYLLTGRAVYLQPYFTAKQRMQQCEKTLTDLLAGSEGDDMRPHLVALERSVADKLAELDQTIALTRSGRRDEALRLVNTDLGKQRMDAIRGEAHRLTETAAARRKDVIARIAAIEGLTLTLVALFGLGSLALMVVGLRAEGNRARAAAEAEQAGALREANERAQLLARELNHRVKNLFAIVMAIVSLSGRRRPDSGAVVEDIHSRIHALAMAHEVSQGQIDGDDVTLGALLERIASPFVGEDGNRMRLAGPTLTLAPRMVTPFGLIFHELATNAVKYGALSADGGQVQVDWEVLPDGGAGGELHLQWIERGGPALGALPTRSGPRGFGSRMISLAVQQLDGRIEQQWPETGAVVRLVCPWVEAQGVRSGQ